MNPHTNRSSLTRRQFLRDSALTGILASAAPGILFSQTQSSGAAACDDGLVYVVDGEGQRPAPIVAVENVCAWPNLTRLPDGTIVALIYNQPSHGQKPGDVDCWASEDEGRTWVKRGTAAPRETPEQNRMNVAAGLTTNGTLILVCSGWSDPGKAEAQGRRYYGNILTTWVCRSKDGGATWVIDKTGFPLAPGAVPLVPFGDIMPGKDGRLRVSAYYGWNYIVRGDGEGVTWELPVRMSKDTRFNETAVLHLGDGRWLAAARRDSQGLTVLYSEDDAQTWTSRGEVTGDMMHPGHLMQLRDGTLLLSYGHRNRPSGVDVLFSDDEGRTWSTPYRILDANWGDFGYPSSVQLKDGRILTAYYAKGIPGHSGYHMGIVCWDPVATRAGSR